MPTRSITLLGVLWCAQALANPGADSCIMFLDMGGRSQVQNTCGKPITFVFCGTDSGHHLTNVGVCGRDLGGGMLRPGESRALTQSTEPGVRYFFAACYTPDHPLSAAWTGSSIRANCAH